MNQQPEEPRPPALSVLAMRYTILSRRAGKYAEIVGTNVSQISAITRTVVHEKTTPNGLPQGGLSLEIKTPKGIVTMLIGDWVVVDAGVITVCPDDEFKHQYGPLTGTSLGYESRVKLVLSGSLP